MTEERFPHRDFLKVTASTALTFGADLPATAQTSASAREPHLLLFRELCLQGLVSVASASAPRALL